MYLYMNITYSINSRLLGLRYKQESSLSSSIPAVPLFFLVFHGIFLFFSAPFTYLLWNIPFLLITSSR